MWCVRIENMESISSVLFVLITVLQQVEIAIFHSIVCPGKYSLRAVHDARTLDDSVNTKIVSYTLFGSLTAFFSTEKLIHI